MIRGQVDNLFQSLPVPPVLHVIIEPHQDVLQHMREQGWYNKPGVKILEGRWQEFVGGAELSGLGGFDVIFTDTFSEDYRGTRSPISSQFQKRLLAPSLPALHQFFQTLPNLLAESSSRFSFFNGLGATRE